MESTLWKLRSAILALLTALSTYVKLWLMSSFGAIARKLPSSFIPENFPKRFLKKEFSVSITYKSFLMLLKVRYKRFLCPLKVGDRAPNINILTLQKMKKKLSDFQNKGRPLVLNFGSCS